MDSFKNGDTIYRVAVNQDPASVDHDTLAEKNRAHKESIDRVNHYGSSPTLKHTVILPEDCIRWATADAAETFYRTEAHAKAGRTKLVKRTFVDAWIEEAEVSLTWTKV